jgi:hypothetical protein
MNTPYTTKLWEIATALDINRRRMLQAYLVVYLYHHPAELETALFTAEQQLPFLDPPFVQKTLSVMLDHMEQAARQWLETVPVDEYQDIVQFELKHRLAALQSGELTEEETTNAMCHFGEQHFLAAQRAVEDCLANGQSSEIRGEALDTLVKHWQLPEYQHLLPTFLDDPDPYMRARAILLLEQDRQRAQDEATLKKIALIALSEEQEPIDRLIAYEALQTIAGIPYNEQQSNTLSTYIETLEDFAAAPGVDWDLIKRYC